MGLSDLAYVITPYQIDTGVTKPETIKTRFQKVARLFSGSALHEQCTNILTVAFREDVYFGTVWVTNDGITIQQLPSDYCVISSSYGNVYNVQFNFQYFDSNKTLLPNYPDEFNRRYEDYRSGKGAKWQELDSPYSFAIKCNSEIPNYAVPPLAGILREIYDLEDYKLLKMSKTELENYAILVTKLKMADNGDWLLDLPAAQDFWRNLSSVLPSQIGTVLSPMEIEKIDFKHNANADIDEVAETENHLYAAAGVSSLLFNNPKASANALALSIKVDQAVTFRLVQSIECALNRLLHTLPYGKNFSIRFLDVSWLNRKEAADSFLKACQFGLPMVSHYCATQGLTQSDMDCMNFLEDDVLGIKERFVPLRSSATMSGEAGAPEKPVEELSEKGEETRESE